MSTPDGEWGPGVRPPWAADAERVAGQHPTIRFAQVEAALLTRAPQINFATGQLVRHTEHRFRLFCFTSLNVPEGDRTNDIARSIAHRLAAARPDISPLVRQFIDMRPEEHARAPFSIVVKVAPTGTSFAALEAAWRLGGGLYEELRDV